MTDQSSTSPTGDDHGTDPRDLIAEFEAVESEEDAAPVEHTTDPAVPGDAADRSDVATPGATPGGGSGSDEDGGHGPMVSDAAIDWSSLDGGADESASR
ncbi:hypothetical protein [Labedella endophytica]|jgi:hypothetical protein|uniref:Uncharacterized protein n=1 Tax=Labedella endophytica TaxID=1523160 RepID=A0A433JPE5_9MICO|nr:hypothetical protein [Labedella endophytica]RUQ98309.1 hypothetical protein ELQ94_15000 [Labedella endophytica]